MSLNATQAITLWRGGGTLLSLGRVQTPTLSLIVGREDEITRFVPRPYFEVEATLQPAAARVSRRRRLPRTFSHAGQSRFSTAELADGIVTRDSAVAVAEVEEIAEKTVREPPPLLFDLGALQRTANRRFGFSADQTLKLAQALYKSTSSSPIRGLMVGISATICRRSCRGCFRRWLTVRSTRRLLKPLVAGVLRRAGSPRIFADHKVSDHHAIIPTAVDVTPARIAALSDSEARIFDLIARRFLSAFYPDAEFRDTQVRLRVDPVSRGSAKKSAVAPSRGPSARNFERASVAPGSLSGSRAGATGCGLAGRRGLWRCAESARSRAGCRGRSDGRRCRRGACRPCRSCAWDSGWGGVCATGQTDATATALQRGNVAVGDGRCGSGA